VFGFMEAPFMGFPQKNAKTTLLGGVFFGNPHYKKP
jgi:hypothetical protein